MRKLRGVSEVPEPAPPVGVVLVGVHGHGRSHLTNLARLSPRIVLAGICDPSPPSPQQLGPFAGVPTGPELEPLLEAVRPSVTIVCTPIHTHVDLTLRAVARGSNVLLEKPPTPSRAEFERLVAGVREHRRVVQIGFQSLGSAAIHHVTTLLADGSVGEPLSISAACAWARDESYFSRAPWAGKRRLGGVDVVDGVLTNPFAHAIATALRLDGSEGRRAATDIEVELYRGNAIEADDTSAVRLRTPAGTPVTIAATLCAESSRDPVITVRGTRGVIEYAYKRSAVTLLRPDHPTNPRQSWVLPTTDLLENLVGHLNDPREPLLAPPESTRSFMDVLEAVRLASDPRPIGDPFTVRRVENGVGRIVVPGIEEVVRRAAETGSLFSELDVAWAGALRTPRSVVRR
jgi:predicted dehydrogenase